MIAAVIPVAVLGGQVTVDLPGEVGSYRSQYGEAVETALGSLARELGAAQGQAVRVRGTLGSVEGSTLALRDGGAALLLIPVVELRDAPLHTLLGRRVEVVGVARRLLERQSRVPCWDVLSAPESWCEDPQLPPLPDRQGHPSWPRNSVTFWGIVEATPVATDRRERSQSALIAIVDDPARFDGADVRVRGRFRGGNLFGDLPASTRLGREDWVISDGDAALWVTGKPPRGEGWRLALDDERESRWWIDVQGRVEVRDGVPYLRAKKLALAPPPDR